jgi:autotransporter-associated beta strand protein
MGARISQVSPRFLKWYLVRLVRCSVWDWKSCTETNSRNQSSMKTSSRLNLPLWLLATILPVAILMFSAQTSHAASASWLPSPPDNDWNNAANWTVGGPPNGPSDTATFNSSNQTGILLSENTEVSNIVLNAGASAYSITATPFFVLTISGVGITNNSGITQNFAVTADGSGNRSSILFTNTATAGMFTTFTINGIADSNAGATQFFNGSTADHATFINNAGRNAFFGGGTEFFDASSADHGTFINNGSVTTNGGDSGVTRFSDNSTAGMASLTNNGSAAAGSFDSGETRFDGAATAGNATVTTNGGTADNARGGVTQFFNQTTAANGTFTTNGSAFSGDVTRGASEFYHNSTAGNGTFTINGSAVTGGVGGVLRFRDNSTAGAATLISNGGLNGGQGGTIIFLDGSGTSGNTSRVQLFGNGNVDVSAHNPANVVLGSIEGDGNVFLGGNRLVVGSNSRDTTFSGVIQNGGIAGGIGGRLTMIGSGTLRLSGANTYTGTTTLSNVCRLFANNSVGSGTGSGAVTVNNSSVLGGIGTIGGPVTVASGAALLGGNATTATGSLTLANNLTMNSGAIIELVLGPSGAHSTLTRTGGTWTFAPNQRFTFLDLGAQPGAYDNIITGLASDPGGTASWTITNAGFAGTFAYDGAGNIDLNITSALGPALQLTGAVSRKMHGGLGLFDIDLPLVGQPGVECRSSGGTHTLVFSFTNNSVSGNATVTSGTGVAGSPTFAGNTMTVNLTGVTDVQKVTVTLSNVMDSFAQVLPDNEVSVNMLIGDTNGNRSVNAGDIGQTKGQSGAPVTGSNFRSDVNVNGTINAGDIGLVKSRSGTSLP